LLADASRRGRAFIDRELHLPECWTDDPERCRVARVPEHVEFRTKPQLAQLMLERALDAGVPAWWVTADEVYGGSPTLRQWLEGRGVGHVLAVKCTEPLVISGPDGPVRATAEQLAAAVPAEQWVTASAGQVSRAAGCTTGPASSWPPRPPAGWAGGCWCAAAALTVSWPSTPAVPRPPRR
jgi:hypothetical protein